MLGLMSCSSSNPCVYCNRQRSKVDGVLKWAEEVEGLVEEESKWELRTFASLNMNYAGWVDEGRLVRAVHTRKWKSVNTEPLVEGAGYNWDKLVLARPLHLPSTYS